MANEVYTTEEIRLLDETEVELRPLPIAKLRKFMRLWSDHIAEVQKRIAEDDASEDMTSGFSQADLTDAQFDVFIKMCALGLSAELKGDRTDKQFITYLEDVLDEKTIYRILERTGGLNLGPDANPNPQNPALVPGAGNN